MTHREAFEAHLKDNPTDWTTRLVYADWLEDNDEPEKADRQRRWKEAWTWLTEFGERHRLYKGPLQGMIDAGFDRVFSGSGGDSARDEMQDAETRSLFWVYWSVVTGRVPLIIDESGYTGFGCFC